VTEPKHITPENRSTLADLFANHRRQRLVINSVLEHPFGTAIADAENSPKVARLKLGGFTLFAGNPDHPVASRLIQDLDRALIIPESQVWHNAVIAVHGENLRKTQRFGFSLENLNIDHLRELQQHIPEGYRIQQADTQLAPQIINAVTYTSPEEFLEYGIGFCAIAGNQIVSAALAYTSTSTGIEIQIYTHSDHRQKGLATLTSATLIAHCLEHGIEPHWNAANPISAALAEKLGYVQNDVYQALILHRPEQPKKHPR